MAFKSDSPLEVPVKVTGIILLKSEIKAVPEALSVPLAAMGVSDLVVIGNALRLLRWRK